jgi:hypothetical protein
MKMSKLKKIAFVVIVAWAGVMITGALRLFLNVPAMINGVLLLALAYYLINFWKKN